MEQYGVHSIKEYLSLMTSASLPGLNTVIDVVIGIAMIIGFIVIFQAMYTAVMERTREIGILKSLGADKLYIVNVVLRETATNRPWRDRSRHRLQLCGQGGPAGAFPDLAGHDQLFLLVKAAIIALVGAMLGAFYPAIKAAQKDPIDALAYE